jgi:hypothetical protein
MRGLRRQGRPGRGYSQGVQKGVRITEGQDEFYRKLSQRLNLSPKEGAYGFTELVREALDYLVLNHPEAIHEVELLRQAGELPEDFLQYPEKAEKERYRREQRQRRPR